MSTAQTMPTISPQTYLEAERRAAFKSEYFDGHVYAMAGGTRAHIILEGNLGFEVVGRLRGRSCESYGSNMKVWIPSTRAFVYPDLTIACGSPKLRDDYRDVLENPVAIFEILSPSTEMYDRTLKFDGFCSIPDFAQYVLISQVAPRVEVFTKNAEGFWIFTRFTGLDATAEFSTVGIEVPMASLYDRIEFAAA